MHQMLSLSTDAWICHISSRVQVWIDSNAPPPPPPNGSAKKVATKAIAITQNPCKREAAWPLGVPPPNL